MDRTVPLALGGAFAWGVWALLTKLATRTLAPEVALVVSYVTGAAVGLAYLLVSPTAATPDATGLAYALGAGLATGVGSVLYYYGLDVGDVSVVSTLTGLYFVVAALLGVLVLGEALSLRNAAGVALAGVAVALLST